MDPSILSLNKGEDVKVREFLKNFQEVTYNIYSWLALSHNPEAIKKLFENHSAVRVKKL